MSEHVPATARKLRDFILDAVTTTGDHAYTYKPGRVAGTRALVGTDRLEAGGAAKPAP